MYQKNADVFQEYFQDLKIYYEKGNLNPADSTSSFFTTLYQKMFKVLLLIEPLTETQSITSRCSTPSTLLTGSTSPVWPRTSTS